VAVFGVDLLFLGRGRAIRLLELTIHSAHLRGTIQAGSRLGWRAAAEVVLEQAVRCAGASAGN
jgi:hypothetical protein